MKISQDIIDSLVIRAQKGDMDSFSLLYDELLDPIFRFCFFKVNSREIAEDITSEVFLNVWKKLESYKKTDNLQFSSWVFRIAHNKVMDFFRRNKETLELNEEVENDLSTYNEGVKKIANDLLRKELMQYLKQIPAQQAESIILKYFSELENSEIAEVMEKTETAVRILQSRGIKTIRAFMETQQKYETSSATSLPEISPA